jgi:hypothetical protein
LTDAVEVEILEDGSLVALGRCDWQRTLLDAASIIPAGSVGDDSSTWDIYYVTDKEGVERTYALQVT